ncbi:hypothetical protein, partial [Staphylococcus aureus]|uniref:hypothetical protein n=1 Tax=Staphylococcus aureus TaxID=1280 RepID=UPI001C9302C0
KRGMGEREDISGEEIGGGNGEVDNGVREGNRKIEAGNSENDVEEGKRRGESSIDEVRGRVNKKGSGGNEMRGILNNKLEGIEGRGDGRN